MKMEKMNSVNKDEKRIVEPQMDVVEKSIGSLGRYQILLGVFISLCKTHAALHQMAIIFLAPPVNYVCPDTNATTCPCDEPDYDRSVFQDTIVTSWHLVCERAWLKDVTQTLHMLGTLVGSVLFGLLSDRYGRRKPLLGAMALQLVAGVCAAFAPDIWTFTLLRFLVGLSVGGAMVVSFVVCMEFLGHEHRATMSILFHVFFNLGLLLLPGVGYLCRSWFSYQLVVSSSGIIFVYFYWLVPESPRWLLATKNMDEAIHILEMAAKVNHLPTKNIRGDTQAYQIVKSHEEVIEGSLLDLFKFPNMRRNILAMAFNWIVCGYCFYGIAQYVGHLSGDIFVNVAANGCVIIPGAFIAIILLKKLGRKTVIISCHIACSICLFSIAIVPVDIPYLQVALACIADVSAFTAFVVLYLYCSEMFPTVVRNSALGVCSMLARVGSMVAPFVATLDAEARWLPPVLFGVLPIFGALCCLVMPETTGIHLMTTLEEGENFGSKKPAKKATIELVNLGFDSNEGRF